MDVFIEALEELGHALVEHNHIWTNKQRRLYGRAHKEAERVTGRVQHGEDSEAEACRASQDAEGEAEGESRVGEGVPQEEGSRWRACAG